MATKKAATKTAATKTAASKKAVSDTTEETKAPATKAAAEPAAKTPAKKAAGTGASTTVDVQAGAAKGAPTHDEIAKQAHSYWEQRGHHHGSHVEDWLRAERELGKK